MIAKLLPTLACGCCIVIAGCAAQPKPQDMSAAEYRQSFLHPPNISAADEAKSDSARLAWFKSHHPEFYDSAGNFFRGSPILVNTGPLHKARKLTSGRGRLEPTPNGHKSHSRKRLELRHRRGYFTQQKDLPSAIS